MLVYHDYSGQLVNKFLGLSSINSSWFLFERQNMEQIVNYIKNYLGQQYIVLNHQSYSPMNVKLMDYQGAFGLSNMPNTRKNKYLSQKASNNSNIYNDISIINEVTDDELSTYLYKAFYNDFGLILKNYNKEVDLDKFLKAIESKELSDEMILKLCSISLFIDYDDCYRGLLILHSSKLLNNTLEKSNNDISFDKITEINENYGCRLAGSIKVSCDGST